MASNSEAVTLGDGVMASRRCMEIAHHQEFLLGYLVRCQESIYDPVTNPQGYVNLGSSVNALCSDLIVEKVNAEGTFQFDATMQHYNSYWGTPNLRNAMARFLTEKFHANQPVDPDHLVVCNGVTGCLDACAFCLGDQGDVFITPTPAYTRIFSDCKERAGVDVVGFQLTEKESFTLTADLLENSIKQQLANGKNVRAFILTNPSNPLGDIYPPQTLLDLMKVCKRHEMHFISDEVYALSCFEDSSEFHSILSFPYVPDPMKTHVLYGLSKDLGMASMRVAVIHTLNKDMLAAMKLVSFYEFVPLCVQEMTAKILDDEDWIENVYLPQYKLKLNEAYKWTKKAFEAMGIPVRQSEAGLFLMADFRQFIHPVTKEGEMALHKKLYQNKVFILPGTELMMKEPGWFRIIVSVSKDNLEEGICRIKKVLQEVKN